MSIRRRTWPERPSAFRVAGGSLAGAEAFCEAPDGAAGVTYSLPPRGGQTPPKAIGSGSLTAGRHSKRKEEAIGPLRMDKAIPAVRASQNASAPATPTGDSAYSSMRSILVFLLAVGDGGRNETESACNRKPTHKSVCRRRSRVGWNPICSG